MTTTPTPTVFKAATLSNDQVLAVTFTGGTADAEGYPTGAVLDTPALALQDPTGAPLADGVLLGTDPNTPLTVYLKRAAFAAGDAGTLPGQLVATFASGAVEVQPFTFLPGAASGITESKTVMPLAAIPATVVFPAQEAAPADQPGGPATGGTGV